ncbi:RNA polymerase sigma factor [Allonocardiopsis opalescens]|uniref:RNA polymerase sigma-70 factor (ECF subfamily) n=1 Tax=Allonocardiopsis opalescens TaxID=1144618 RepID=A0A2T0PWP3_9ACTN|nr:RNA polymerase sigma factor [Allonocardiopsis opalescens]PRX95788.1 RNA polymerase sigma-70 factor (ECF subfamily) [Allonocardiopsis opalescens]
MSHPGAGGEVALIGRDPDAFEAFYRANVAAVQRFVARRVDDPHRAADLTADVFVAVIESAHTYRPGRGGPVGWLYGVARNVVAADRRRSAKEDRTARQVAGRRLVDEDDLAGLVDRIDAQAEARRAYRAMDGLSEGERAVLELVALDGLSAGQAARVLGIGAVAARVRLHRARRVVQDRLSRLGVSEVAAVPLRAEA